MDTAPTIVKRPLYDMFNAVPRRYDLVNHVITLGLDTRWRLSAAKACLASSPRRALDLGCGTGDLAINIARLSTGQVEVSGLDYSAPMLRLAREKAGALSGSKPSFVRGDAASLPFPDGCFDCVGISFAFRNLTYRNPFAGRYLAEVVRVLADGGKFVIIETSQPRSGFIRALFHVYLRAYVKTMGALVSGNRGAYRYLAESAARFYDRGELKELLLRAGFSAVSFQPHLFGAVGVCAATK